jgi:hypothetical protein
MTQELVKKAFASAEQERQEKEIKRIKEIVQSYLEKIQNKAEQKDKLDEEIRFLKKDLDDLKAGRLDRIMERQEKDERAREVSIIIVKEIHEKLVPYYPWRSPWIVEWRYPSSNGTIKTFTSINDSGNINYIDCSETPETFNQSVPSTLTVTGQVVSNFTGGSYNINGKIINL